MKIFLRHDLFKNVVTIDGVKYVVRQDPAEGYEAYQSKDGKTLYRKPVGQGQAASPKKGPASGVGEGTEPKKIEKDPLKFGDKPEKGPDLSGAQKIQEQMAKPQAKPGDEHRDFSEKVVASAVHGEGVKGWRGRAYIHGVYEHLKDQGHIGDMSLDEFKQKLVEAQKKGHVSLLRADMVQAMDPEDVKQSKTQRGSATFNFIDTEDDTLERLGHDKEGLKGKLGQKQQAQEEPSKQQSTKDFPSSFMQAFSKLDKDRLNQVSLHELRKEMPGVSEEEFNEGLKKLRQEGKFVLEPYEGRHGGPMSDEMHAGGIKEGGEHYAYVARRDFNEQQDEQEPVSSTQEEPTQEEAPELLPDHELPEVSEDDYEDYKWFFDQAPADQDETYRTLSDEEKDMVDALRPIADQKYDEELEAQEDAEAAEAAGDAADNPPEPTLRDYKWAESNWKPWAKKLDRDSRMAIMDYKGADYLKLNGMLRGTEQLSPEDQKQYKELSDKLSQLIKDSPAVHEPVTVFRGTSLPEGILRPGTRVSDKAFVSTSLNPKWATIFAKKAAREGHKNSILHIDVPKGAQAMYLGSGEEGVYEDELLLPQGATFEITHVGEVDPETGAQKIHAKLVPQEDVATGGAQSKFAEIQPDENVADRGEIPEHELPQTVGGEAEDEGEPSPFSLQEDDHADTAPEEHYHAANLADKIGDKKAAQFHRDQARQKIGDDPVMHDDMARKLKEAGYHDDAEHHRQQKLSAIQSKADPDFKSKQEAAARLTPGQRAQARKKRAEVADRVARKQQGEAPTEAGAGATTAVDDATSRPTVTSKPTEVGGPSTGEYDAVSPDELEDVTPKPAEDAKKEAQKKATEGLKEKQSQYEKEHSEWKSKNKEYEDAHAKHEKDTKQWTEDLDRVKSKMDEVKQGKPARDDKEETSIRREIQSLTEKMNDHKADAPSDTHLKEARRKIQDLQAKAPSRPKSDAEQSSYEKRVSEHKKKLGSLKSQLRVMEAAHDSRKTSHGNKTAEYQEKIRDLKKKHRQAKEKADKTHSQAMEKWKAKHEATKKELEEHRASKPQKPDLEKPPSKPPEEPPKAPESDSEALAHEDHTKSASKLADNIASHLEDDSLDEDVRSRLQKLHKQATEQAALAHTPTKEDKKALKEASSRAEEHGAHESLDEKKQREAVEQQKEQEKDQKQQEKEQKVQEKQQQKQQESTPQQPQNEIEEAKLSEHKRAHQEKLDKLNTYLENSGDSLDDDEKRAIDLAKQKFEEQANRDTLPSKEEQKELKDIEGVVKRHLKEADKPQKEEEGGEEKPQTGQASRKPKRSFFSRMKSAYDKGGAMGSQLGSAAADPYGGGGMTSVVDYATRGVFSAGHSLLRRREEKDSKGVDPNKQDKGQREADAVAKKRAKVDQ